ncbi:SGNH/GDSL hydrolase family protein [Microbacterium betulae]|uniref:SGNH/GDSL hydrolase family protein n=1 Tax=Microbacterium betulae TaxID=2981139 RepID=A0AA97FHF0_9MICO|nr:SGNH/GDSL hydrolase family protein [Microbacterium sp. AB]WOF22134.1 SGNH/GDSL hydrolase family protein [Microbacterium sp. AB]
MTEHRKIVGLGSSFAAGPGVEPVEDANAMRSSRNYAHLLADRLGAELTDLSVSGATTATILHTPQTIAAGVEFPPQIDGVPPDADLVTVTAGGNDLQFAGSMLHAAWSRFEPDGPIATMLTQGLSGGVPEPTEESVDAVARGLVAIVAGVRARAENARVVLVDYLTVLDGRDHGEDPLFSDAETAVFLRIQDALVRGHEIAAERAGAELVRASKLSTGHGLGSTEPWVFGFQPSVKKTASSFHPNEAGMSAIADALAARVR